VSEGCWAVVLVVIEGSGSENASSSQESATLVVCLLYLCWGTVLLVADLGLNSDSEPFSVTATDVAADVLLVSVVASDPVGVAVTEEVDFSVVGVDSLLVTFAVAVVLVSTVLLAWAYFRCGGV
jgi:hypothetical protein